MPKHESEPLTRLHVNLYTTDLDFLRSVYGEDSPSGRNLGMAKAIRMFVRSGILRIRERQAAAQGPLPKLEMEDFLDDGD